MRPRHVNRRRLPTPSSSPGTISSTISTPRHQRGQQRHSDTASHTAASGAAICHEVTKLNSAIASSHIEKIFRYGRLALPIAHADRLDHAVVLAVTPHQKRKGARRGQPERVARDRTERETRRGAHLQMPYRAGGDLLHTDDLAVAMFELTPHMPIKRTNVRAIHTLTRGALYERIVGAQAHRWETAMTERPQPRLPCDGTVDQHRPA